MHVVFLLLVGAGAGLIAARVMRPETSLPVTIGIGMVGALLGGILLKALVALTTAFAGLVGAVLGAFLLIRLVQGYVR